MSAAPSAIVIGGSSGIGQACAVALARDGARVVVVGTNEERVEESRRRCAAASAASECGPVDQLGLVCDVTRERDMTAMADAVGARLGGIDLVVFSAGIGQSRQSARRLPQPTAELPLAEWQAVLDVNVTGAFLASRAVAPIMVAQQRGHILNIGSSTTPRGLRGTPFAPAYCASKFALMGLTESLSAELEPHGVRVQLVFPGPVATPLVDQTALARPFGGIVSAEHFAEGLLGLIHQPLDATVIHPHLLPFAPRPAH